MKNPLFLSNYFDESLLADEDKFYGKMREECNLGKNDYAFNMPCMGIHIENRGFDTFFQIMKQFW